MKVAMTGSVTLMNACCLQDPVRFEVTQDSVTLDTPITVYGYDVKVGGSTAVLPVLRDMLFGCGLTRDYTPVY